MDGEVIIKDRTASPAATGFYGLGFAATFAGLLNMGMFSDALVVIAMAIFLGGVSELIAGWQLWKKGDTFGGTAFTIFGLWWLGFSYINLAPAGLLNAPIEAASATSMGYFTLIWGIVATLLTIVTFKIGVKGIIGVFILLDLTFFSLALVFFGMLPLVVAGAITLLVGLAALYLATALVMDEVGKIKMPY